MPAFAAEDTSTTGTITIENSAKNTTSTAKQTYKIYKLLNYTGTEKSGNYSLTDKWKDFFDKGEGSKYFTIENEVDLNGKKLVTLKTNEKGENILNNSTAADFARAALDYAKANGIAEDATTSVGKDGKNATASAEYGYYLLGTTTGSLAALDTATPSVTLVDKNKVPTVEKTVSGSSIDGYKKTTDVNIGDTVSYKAEIQAYAGAENYVYHDKMTDGLDFTGVDSVVAESKDDKGNTVTSTLTRTTDENTNGDYSVRFADTVSDGDTFDVVFLDNYLKTITKDTTITIYYEAVLNDKAVVAPGSDGNKNTAELTYGDDNHTTKTETQTYTYKFNLHKYTGDVKSDALAGAEFSLYKGTFSGTLLKDGKVDTDALSAYTRVSLVKDKDDNTKYTVNAKGKTFEDIVTVEGKDITISGLDEGDYFLVETKTPSPEYNILNDVVPVVISRADKNTANGSYNITNSTRKVSDPYATPIVDVKNRTGSLLPSTGGIGTTIFKVVGGVLVVAAAIYFVIRRKKMA
jgi:fimbrial isopeptide formation D2 family protein/LPXTG-motif cell wall-anchored protein